MKTIRLIPLLLALALLLGACGGAPGETKGAAATSPATAVTEPASSAEEELTEGPSTAEIALDKADAAAEEAAAFFAEGYDALVYHVGPGREYKSFVSLLLDLSGNQNAKTIYIDEGEYDLFAEYMAEVRKGRIAIPPDDVVSGDYFEPYNAFVPNRTKVVGVGNVVLRFTPKADEITVGASHTWSPLNVYGSAMFENITVIGKNCRYCLHNDDHNAYPGSVQYYKNVSFEYQLSETNSEGKLLGFNNTIGFGVNAGSVHLFEDCEIWFNGAGDHSAYYGHEPSSVRETAGTLVLKNCRVYASDPSNARVIRLQSLSHNSRGRVRTFIDGCDVNGGLLFHLYYADSIQNYDVLFRDTARMPVAFAITGNGAIDNPYPVRFAD
jgi:hypothetical protein